MADALWLGDDPMPSCEPCMDGRHHDCEDLIHTPPYGVHACGCTNEAHEDRGPIPEEGGEGNARVVEQPD